jgi:mannose-6-phosphate isomerase-like protein (cupin superfamily)
MESKYDKYIISELDLKKAKEHSSDEPGGQILTIVDDDIIKGAFYLNCAWIWQPTDERLAIRPHTHDFDEYIGFYGTNPKDWYDLNGEVELWLGDEKHLLTRSCAVFIPRGLLHCPIIFRKVNRPIFWFTVGTNATYHKEDHIVRAALVDHLPNDNFNIPTNTMWSY